MKLAVGATSRRLVEVAVELGVHQVVASHAQVKVGGGYTGLDQHELVRLVRTGNPGSAFDEMFPSLAGIGPVDEVRTTDVVRDHGHLVAELDADVEAGFDALHLDVEPYAEVDRVDALLKLGIRFSGDAQKIELGGEHLAHTENVELLRRWYGMFGSESPVSHLVYNGGTYVWADRQVGAFKVVPTGVVEDLATLRRGFEEYQSTPIKFKLHNCDWVAPAELGRFAAAVDVFNVAPELGRLETAAILLTKVPSKRAALLDRAYSSRAWERWFKPSEGTFSDRAHCALRYLQTSDPVVADAWSNLSDEDEAFVRGELRAWIAARSF
jgi:hypothetical protein